MHTHITQPAPGNGLGIASLVLGIITLPSVFCCFGFATGVVSIVLGIIALMKVKSGEAAPASKVLAWAGIVTSALSMLGYLLYFFVVMGFSMNQAFEQMPK